MTLQHGTPSWSLDVPTTTDDYTVNSGRVTFDDRNTVYVQAQITIAPLSAEAFDALDPRPAGIRATLTIGQEVTEPTPDSQAEALDLVVYERTRNVDGTVTLQLASDELLLELRALVDDEIWDVYTAGGVTNDSAREAIDVVLDEFADGASLEAGAVDADVTRTLGVTNLVANPDFETDVAGWVVGVNVSSIVRSTAQSVGGAASLRLTASASDCSIFLDPAINVEPFAWYDFRFKVRANTVARSVEGALRWYDSTGTLIRVDYGAGLLSSTSAWSTYASVYTPQQAPEGASSCRPSIVVRGNVSGNQHYVDDVMFYRIPDEAFKGTAYRPVRPGSGVVAPTLAVLYEFKGGRTSTFGNPSYFDGAGDRDSGVAAFYDYAWTGTAHASTSTRIPKDDHGFDLTLMKPGQSARDFLAAIVDLTGGRLFCDEARDWRLVDDTYTLAGTITLDDETNVPEYEDVTSLSATEDGVPLTFTGVVLAYRSIDRTTGRARVDYDHAGDASGRVFTVTLDAAFPGRGAAAAYLARAAGRGRAIVPDAFVDYTARPGMALDLTVNGTDYTARISRVEFVLNDHDHVMKITPRELTE